MDLVYFPVLITLSLIEPHVVKCDETSAEIKEKMANGVDLMEETEDQIRHLRTLIYRLERKCEAGSSIREEREIAKLKKELVTLEGNLSICVEQIRRWKVDIDILHGLREHWTPERFKNKCYGLVKRLFKMVKRIFWWKRGPPKTTTKFPWFVREYDK